MKCVLCKNGQPSCVRCCGENLCLLHLHSSLHAQHAHRARLTSRAQFDAQLVPWSRLKNEMVAEIEADMASLKQAQSAAASDTLGSMLGGGPVVVPRRRRKRSTAAINSRQARESNTGEDAVRSRSDPYKRIRTVSTFSWNIQNVAKECDTPINTASVPAPQPAWAAAAATAAPLSTAALLPKVSRDSDEPAVSEQPVQGIKEDSAWLSDASTVGDEEDDGVAVQANAESGSAAATVDHTISTASETRATSTASETRAVDDVGASGADQTLRSRAKVLLTRALVSGAKSDTRAESVADGIETSLFANCGEVNAQYKAKLRSLCASLRRERNFRDAALSGTLDASVIGKLKPQQMASSAVLAQRQAMRESAKKAALLPDVVEFEQEETMQYTCPTCGRNRSRALKQTNGASAAASDTCRKDESKFPTACSPSCSLSFAC